VRRDFFPYTPAYETSFTACEKPLQMIREEGLPEHISGRHERHAKAVRAAVLEWGFGKSFAAHLKSTRVQSTAVFTPEGHDADQLRATIPRTF